MDEDRRRIVEIKDELAILKYQQSRLEEELEKILTRIGGLTNILKNLHPIVRDGLANKEGIFNDIELIKYIEGRWPSFNPKYVKAETPEERLTCLRGIGPKRAKQTLDIIVRLM